MFCKPQHVYHLVLRLRRQGETGLLVQINQKEIFLHFQSKFNEQKIKTFSVFRFKLTRGYF